MKFGDKEHTAWLRKHSAKHTAGPWHVGVGNGEGSVFANGGRMRMEEAGTTLYPVCKVFDFDGERDANAALLAAAPELLEACEMFLRLDKGRCEYGPLYSEQVEAVIAKAKGG